MQPTIRVFVFLPPSMVPVPAVDTNSLACDHIMLIDDGSSTVSLPELPLLAVLPGTGGLTPWLISEKYGMTGRLFLHHFRGDPWKTGD